MKILCVIPARGGSKGIEKKNIRKINNKPLIAYTIESTLSSKLFDDVIVSTDDKEIAEISESYGAKVPFIRPSELAQDDATSDQAILHAVLEMQKLGFDQPTYDADQVLAEIADIVPFFKGITRERLGKFGLQWPVKEDGTDTKILHTDEFKLGKGRLKSFDWKESTEITNNQKDYPLILTTSRVLQHYNAATMTRRTNNINIVDEDVLLIHPKDAADRDLNTGDIGRLYSGRGEVALKVEVTDKVKEGIVFTTFHFPEHMVNMVTGHGKDEETMCAEYKVSSVQVQKISNQFKTEVKPKEHQAEVS